MPQKNIQVRMDEKLKKEAEKVFSDIGIDTPTAIRIFFTKVAHIGGIPFLLTRDTEQYTEEQIEALDNLARQAKQDKDLSPPFTSADDLIDALHS